MPRKCTLCGKPIILVPSAKERAERWGGKASDYEALFTTLSLRLSTEQLAQFTNRWEMTPVKKTETHLIDTPLFKGITVIKHNRGGKKRRHNRGGKQ